MLHLGVCEREKERERVCVLTFEKSALPGNVCVEHQNSTNKRIGT